MYKLTSKFVTVAVSLLFCSGVTAVRRDPVEADWFHVRFLIDQEIHRSTCVKEIGHWDYPPTYGNALNTRGEDDCEYFPTPRNPKPLGSRLVRMAFHDAMGRSDGFVDIIQDDHRGLESAIAVLDRIFADHGIDEYLTKADFYAWSYHTAVLFACQLQSGTGEEDGTDYLPDMPVRYGRPDYNTEDPPVEDISNGNLVHASLTEYFGNKFGFDERETSIIMGAHNLGGARRLESGHTGMWVQGKNDLDIQYFENLFNPTPLDCEESKTSVEVSGMEGCVRLEDEGLCDTGEGNRCGGWEQIMIRNSDKGPKYQWRHSCNARASQCTHIMLNVDMTLLRDFDDFLDNETGQVTFPDGFSPTHEGAPSYCGQPDPTSGSVRIFAECFAPRTTTESYDAIESYSHEDVEPHTERNMFLDEFGEVFDKMISTVDCGIDSLNVLSIGLKEPSGTIRTNQGCPVGDEWCVDTGDIPFKCSQCRAGYCATMSNGASICKASDYVPRRTRKSTGSFDNMLSGVKTMVDGALKSLLGMMKRLHLTNE